MGRKGNSKLLGRITIILVICCCSLAWADVKYGGGTGEPNDPYQIWDANHMQAIGADANDWDEHFKLMADIDLGQFDGKEGRDKFNMIGILHPNDPKNKPFTGVFDGNCKTISNFTYLAPNSSGVGMFGWVKGFNTAIKDLTLIDPFVEGYSDCGCLVALLGWPEGGLVTGCGIENGHISGSTYHVGSLIGVSTTCTVRNCYATGYVSSGGHSGGLIGRQDGGAVSGCYFRGIVEGRGGTMGGLIGHIRDSGIVTNCYSQGSVQGNSDFVSSVGGLVGMGDQATISNCYSTCSVSDLGEYGGGLIGDLGGFVDVINSFWDVNSSGQDQSRKGTGKTTEEMKQQATFGDWDFINVWDIGENQTYPYLRTFLASDINKDRITNFLDLCIVGKQWMNKE